MKVQTQTLKEKQYMVLVPHKYNPSTGADASNYKVTFINAWTGN